MSDSHRIYSHVDVTKKIEAESILIDKLSITEAGINKNLSKVKNSIAFTDRDNPAVISSYVEQTKELVDSYGHIATKLHRIRNENEKFQFYDICPTKNHHNVSIAGEPHRESPEDQKIIRREERLIEKMRKNEALGIDNQPVVTLACAHPRNVYALKRDIIQDQNVREMFVPVSPDPLNEGYNLTPVKVTLRRLEDEHQSIGADFLRRHVTTKDGKKEYAITIDEVRAQQEKFRQDMKQPGDYAKRSNPKKRKRDECE